MIEEYLRQLKCPSYSVSPNLERFKDWATEQGKQLVTLTNTDFQNFYLALIQSGEYQPRTVLEHRTNIRQFYRWLKTEHNIVNNAGINHESPYTVHTTYIMKEK